MEPVSNWLPLKPQTGPFKASLKALALNFDSYSFPDLFTFKKHKLFSRVFVFL
jgi:hypothetical protein